MSIRAVIVDGKDLSELGFVVDNGLSGWRNSLSIAQLWRRLPGRVAAIRATAEDQYDAREIVIPGTQVADSLAQLKQWEDELKWRLSRGELEVKFAEEDTRFYRAWLDGEVQVGGIQPVQAQRGHRVRIPLICPDGREWSDTEESVAVADTDGAVDVPLGTALVRPVVTVDLASFTLTYRDSGGTQQAQLQVSGASTTPVTVDMEARTITTANGGEIDTLASGDFFALDPRDGDYPSSTWPTVELSGGTGTATFVYRKAYL